MQGKRAKIKCTVTNVGAMDFRSLKFFSFELTAAIPLPPRALSKKESKAFINEWSGKTLRFASSSPDELDDWIDALLDTGARMVAPERGGELSSYQRYQLRDPENNMTLENFEDIDVIDGEDIDAKLVNKARTMKEAMES